MNFKLIFFITSLFIGSLMTSAKDVTFTIKDSNGEITYKIIDSPEYKVYFDNVVHIESAKNIKGHFLIPKSVFYNGTEFFVEGISSNAFNGDSGITEISIPPSVYMIEPHAFRKSKISKFEFEEEQVPINDMKFDKLVIEDKAFEKCKMTDIKLPNKRVSLYGNCFYGCDNLTNVILPDAFTFDNAIFNQCKNIANVVTTSNDINSIAMMFDDECPWKKKILSRPKKIGDTRLAQYQNMEKTANFSIQNESDEYTTAPSASNKREQAQNGKPNGVDTNIPSIARDGQKTFALIIANENYKREGSVPYAENDGKIFGEYLKRTLGVPEKNIQIFNDASLNDMKFGINKLGQICKAYRGAASVIVYYAGHGVSNDKTREASLLPTDGYGSDSSTGYPLKSLYATLATLPAQKTMVFIDACFSGAQRADGMMESNARGIMIKPKRNIVGGKLVVLSATSDDQRAYPYETEGHGLFTYFLLKKIQESKGNVTLGELADYVIQNVEQVSVVENDKIQSPTVTASPTFPNWKKINL